MDIKVKALLIIAVSAVVFASCNKKNDDAPQVNPTTSIDVVNTSANTINFYLNGTRINSSSSFYPGGTLGYITVTAGTQNYEAKIAGNTNSLFTLNYNLSADSVYSVYIAGSTPADVFKTADTLTPDTGGYARLRFVNASPDAGVLDLSFEGTENNIIIDTVKFKDVAYKTTTNFIRVKGGVINLAMYQSAAPANPLRDTVTLNGGNVYTYYGYGSTKILGNQGLAAGLITNQ